MKRFLQGVLLLLLATCAGAKGLTDDDQNATKPATEASEQPSAAELAQPKLLRISATVDGSGRIIFTANGVRYEHKHWAPPTSVTFDGEPWADLAHTPPAWRELGEHLDLSKAWIVQRKGRDMIALEHTADGFDLYLCDSPNGAGHYEVTIAIPRRN